MAAQSQDPFARGDILVQRIIERKVQELSTGNPLLLAVYGKYREPLNNFITNILGPVDPKHHPIFGKPKIAKPRQPRKKKATAVPV